ncbi:hypothetical protein [Streptomyces sp. NPDC046909]|uniref:hypothetical protein n=1 Tax=Streptomyces sp. NPDC046909 TaxID=3155617 RepID=UPI003401D709
MKRAALPLSLLALVTLTACGGGDGDTSDKTAADKPKATASQAKQVSPAERLAELMVTKADVPGYNVEKLSAEYAFATSADQVSTDKASCKPLALAMNQLPQDEPEADLSRYLSKSWSDPSTYITLAAYTTDTKAEAALTGLQKAVGACGAGFTAKAGKNTSTYGSVTAEKAITNGALAFASTLTYQGITHTVHTEAVRDGDVLAVYFGVNGGAIAQGRPSDAKLSAAGLKAQNAKLG